MIFSKITVEIFPKSAWGQSTHRLEVRVRTQKKEYSRTQIINEDHLNSLYDLIMDGIKEEMRRDLLSEQ